MTGKPCSILADVLYTVRAQDSDVAPPNNVVRYAIVSDAHDKFSMGTESGAVKLVGTLDREGDRSQYSLVVSAQDSGVPSKSAEQTIIIKVSQNNLCQVISAVPLNRELA